MKDPPRLSSRAPWYVAENAFSRLRRRLLANGVELLDLTESNPTRVGLDYPDQELADLLGEAARSSYEPAPLGIPAAREAVAKLLSTRDDSVDPSDIAITASSSESYAFLFKMFCEPGDSILTHSPSYPLLDHLARLEGVALHHFPLGYVPGAARRWIVDPDRVRSAVSDRTRLVVAVHPNNPTGHFLSLEEQDAVVECVPPDGALVSDEVFADYVLDSGVVRAGVAAARDDVLSFSLGGLSKSAGLPHWKLGWVRVGGPRATRLAALHALELIADAYLSVNTPVQAALPKLVGAAGRIRAAIQSRLERNLTTLRALLAPYPSIEPLPVEGGWSAVIRVPAREDDESLVLELLEHDRVAVYPGYFFDFHAEGFLVVSLLVPPTVFDQGVRRLAERAAAR